MGSGHRRRQVSSSPLWWCRCPASSLEPWRCAFEDTSGLPRHHRSPQLINFNKPTTSSEYQVSSAKKCPIRQGFRMLPCAGMEINQCVPAEPPWMAMAEKICAGCPGCPGHGRATSQPQCDFSSQDCFKIFQDILSRTLHCWFQNGAEPGMI